MWKNRRNLEDSWGSLSSNTARSKCLMWWQTLTSLAIKKRYLDCYVAWDLYRNFNGLRLCESSSVLGRAFSEYIYFSVIPIYILYKKRKPVSVIVHLAISIKRIYSPSWMLVQSLHWIFMDPLYAVNMCFISLGNVCHITSPCTCEHMHIAYIYIYLFSSVELMES